jgi:hypothetical protein
MLYTDRNKAVPAAKAVFIIVSLCNLNCLLESNQLHRSPLDIAIVWIITFYKRQKHTEYNSIPYVPLVPTYLLPFLNH